MVAIIFPVCVSLAAAAGTTDNGTVVSDTMAVAYAVQPDAHGGATASVASQPAGICAAGQETAYHRENSGVVSDGGTLLGILMSALVLLGLIVAPTAL
jgi:hypothetical protein